MGQRTNNLHTFIINKDNFKEGLVGLFELDSDYNGDNGDEYWEMSHENDENGDPISIAKLEGYETEAERLVNNIHTSSHENEVLNMEKCITSTLYQIEECHGSFSTQFNFVVNDLDDKFVISISYLT